MLKRFRIIILLFSITISSLVFAQAVNIGVYGSNVNIEEIADKVYLISGSGTIDKRKFHDATSEIKSDSNYTIKIQDNNVRFPSDSEELFSKYKTKFDFPQDLDVSNVINMLDMFSATDFLPDVSKWNVSNVKNMQRLFYYTKGNPNVEDWDVRKVTNFSGLFSNARNVTPNLSKWKFNKTENILMGYMFNEAVKANPDVSGWDTSNVISMSGMFKKAAKANPDVSKWDTSKVIYMSEMFSNANVANPDVSKWNTNKVTHMNGMFNDASVADPDVSEWNTSNVISMYAMFRGASIANPDVSKWDTSNVKKMGSMFENTRVANPDVSKWKTSEVTDMSGMFSGAINAEPNTSKWDTSKVTYMNSMFEGASIANPDTSKWDTSKVTNMNSMFERASTANPDVSKWNTSKVTYMSKMFKDAIVAKPDVSKWDTSKVTNMSEMFSNAKVANPDVTNWNVEKVTSVKGMFQKTKKADPNIGNWNALALIDASNMFSGYSNARLEGEKSRGFNAPNLKNAENMFGTAYNANPDVSEWKMGNVTNMKKMFYSTKKANPDVSKWDTSNVTTMERMFYFAEAANPDVTNWNVEKVTTVEKMFSVTKKADPNIGNWNALELKNANGMFDFASAATLYGERSRGFNAPKLENAEEMFAYTYANPDVSNWKMGNVTNINSMFEGAKSAKPNIKNWDVSKVENLKEAFNRVDGQGVDFSNMRNMKKATGNLNYLITVENSNVDFIIPGVFFKGSSLEEKATEISKFVITTPYIGPVYGYKISKIKDGVEKNISLTQSVNRLTKEFLTENLSGNGEVFDEEADYRIKRHILTIESTSPIKVYQKDDIADENGMLKEKFVNQFIKNIRVMPEGTKFKVKTPLDTSLPTYNMANPNDPDSIREVDIEIIYPNEDGITTPELSEVKKAKFIIWPNITFIEDPSLDTFADPGRTRIIFYATDKAELFIPEHVGADGRNVPAKTVDSFSANVYVGNDLDKGTKFYTLYKELEKIGVTVNAKDQENDKFIYWADKDGNEVEGINSEENSVVFNRDYVNRNANDRNEIILKAAFLSVHEKETNHIIEGVEFSQKVFDITPKPENIKEISLVSTDVTGLTIDKDGTLHGTPAVVSWANDEELFKEFPITVTVKAGKGNEQTLSKTITLKVFRNQDHANNDIIPDILEVVTNTFDLNTPLDRTYDGSDKDKHPKNISLDLTKLGATKKNANRIVVKTEAFLETADKTNLEDNALFVLTKSRDGIWSIKNGSEYTVVTSEANPLVVEVKVNNPDSIHKKELYAHADNSYNTTTDKGANSDKKLYDIHTNKPEVLKDDNPIEEEDKAIGIDRKVLIKAPDVNNTAYTPNSELDSDYKEMIVTIDGEDIKFIKNKNNLHNLTGGWELSPESSSYNDYGIERESNGTLKLVMPTDETKFEGLNGKILKVKFKDNSDNMSDISEDYTLKTISNAKADKNANPTIVEELEMEAILDEEANVFKTVEDKNSTLNSEFSRTLKFETVENDSRQVVSEGNVIYSGINNDRVEKIAIVYPDGSQNTVLVNVKVYKRVFLQPKIEIVEGDTEAQIAKPVIEGTEDKIVAIKYNVNPDLSSGIEVGKYTITADNGDKFYFNGVEGTNDIKVKSILGVKPDGDLESDTSQTLKTIMGSISKKGKDFWNQDEEMEVEISINVTTTYENTDKTNEDSKTIKVKVLRDTDGDGIPDTIDEDDDNDGISDEKELESGNDPKDALNFKKADKYVKDIISNTDIITIIRQYGEQTNEEDVKEKIIENKDKFFKENPPTDTEWQVIFDTSSPNYDKLRSKEIGEFNIDIKIRFDDDSIKDTIFRLVVVDDEAPIIIYPNGYEKYKDGMAITLSQGIEYNKEFIQTTDNTKVKKDDFVVEGELPKGLSLNIKNIPNGYGYDIIGTVSNDIDFGDKKALIYPLTVTTNDYSGNPSHKITEKIYIKLIKNDLVGLPVYLNVGDETPDAYDYILNVQENIKNGIIKARLIKDPKTNEMIPDVNDKTFIKWKKGVIDTSKEGEFDYTISVVLVSGDLAEVSTKVYVYDTKKVKDIMDQFRYDNTDIVNRFDEKYFGKVHLGPIIPIINKVITEGKFESEKLIGGIEAGIGFKPIKNNDDFKLIAFAQYDNKLVNHLMLGVGAKYKYFKGFARYRASILGKNKYKNEKLVFMNHIDIYGNVYNEFKVLDDFYITTGLGLYLSGGGGKVTKNFTGYDVLTKLDTDLKLEYRNENGLSVYLKPKVDLAYNQYIYKYNRTGKIIYEKPDGYFNYEMKLGFDNKFLNNIKLGASTKYKGGLNNFIDKEYINILDFEIHAGYSW